jgi:excisionase family DNA binding protein
MEEKIIEQLNRIERNSLLAAKNVLTVEDVALLTGMSKSWIYQLTSSHQIPYHKPNNRLIYFDRKEIEEWMLQNRIGTTKEADEAANEYMVRTTGTNGRKKGGRK